MPMRNVAPMPVNVFDGYPWDSFLPNIRTFLCRSERFFITAIFLV